MFKIDLKINKIKGKSRQIYNHTIQFKIKIHFLDLFLCIQNLIEIHRNLLSL